MYRKSTILLSQELFPNLEGYKYNNTQSRSKFKTLLLTSALASVIGFAVVPSANAASIFQVLSAQQRGVPEECFNWFGVFRLTPENAEVCTRFATAAIPSVTRFGEHNDRGDRVARGGETNGGSPDGGYDGHDGRHGHGGKGGKDDHDGSYGDNNHGKGDHDGYGKRDGDHRGDWGERHHRHDKGHDDRDGRDKHAEDRYEGGDQNAL